MTIKNHANMTRTDRITAQALVYGALAKGWTISVYDGEEWTVKRERDADIIWAAMCSTDEDRLAFRTASGDMVGNVWLVYGNGPEELISDASMDTGGQFDTFMAEMEGV